MVDTEFLNKPELELSPPVEQGLNGVVADIESLGLSGFQEMGADADIRMEDGRLIIRRPNTILYEEARQVPFFRSHQAELKNDQNLNVGLYLENPDSLWFSLHPTGTTRDSRPYQIFGHVGTRNEAAARLLDLIKTSPTTDPLFGTSLKVAAASELPDGEKMWNAGSPNKSYLLLYGGRYLEPDFFASAGTYPSRYRYSAKNAKDNTLWQLGFPERQLGNNVNFLIQEREEKPFRKAITIGNRSIVMGRGRMINPERLPADQIPPEWKKMSPLSERDPKFYELGQKILNFYGGRYSPHVLNYWNSKLRLE